MDSAMVTMVAKELENFYGIETTILAKAEMPDSCKKPYQYRYNANKVLQYLAVIKPTNIPYILALTTEEIATKKKGYDEYGILGLGSCPGPCCVVSIARMGVLDVQLKERLVKVGLHEMGHNFGLPHCNWKDPRCLMRDANGTVLTIDEEEKYLCRYCSGFLTNKGFQLRKNS
jgi:archaemetzincin